MATRPAPKPGPKQAYNPRYDVFNQAHIPEGNENEYINNQLFLLFSEGNYLKIKDFIFNNNMIIDIKDEKGNNILHNIIENGTLTENEKVELVKFALSKNVNPSQSNKYNVTPLHLACQIQSKKIVDLLLNIISEINKVDINGNSAMHFAVTGYSVDCTIVDSKNKIKPIIKNEKKDKIDNNLKELMNNINQYLVGDDIVYNNLSHLNEYLSEHQKIFPEKNMKLNENIKNIILEVISNQSMNSEQKYSLLIKKLITERDSIMKDFEKTLNNETVMNLKIQKTNNGWSPDNKDINSVINKYDENEIILKIEKKLKDFELENNNKKNELLNKLDKSLLEVKKYYKTIVNNFGQINFYLNNFNAEKIGGEEVKESFDLINVDKNNLPKVINPEINSNNDEINLENQINNFNNQQDQNWNPEEKSDEFNNIYYTYSDLLKVVNTVRNKYKRYNFAEHVDLIVDLGFHAESMGKLLQKLFTKPNQQNIDVDAILNEKNINDLYSKLRVYIETNKLDKDIFSRNFKKLSVYLMYYKNQINLNDTLSQPNIYIFYLFKFYLWRFEIIIKKMKVKISEFINNIQNNDYNIIYNNDLSDIIVLIINASICLKFMFDEVRKFENIVGVLENKISNIFNFIDVDINNIKNNNEKKILEILTEIIQKDLNEYLLNIKEKNNNLGEIINIYKESFVPLISWIDNILKYIENKSISKILSQFHVLSNGVTEIQAIDKIVGYKFYNTNNKLPDTYDKFLEEFSGDYKIYKKKYFNKYVPKISNEYPQVFYHNYIKQLQPGYLVSTINKPEYINNNELGNIEIKQADIFKKNDVKYPVIFSSEFANYHIGLLKYQILKQRLSDISRIINSSKTHLKPNEIEIKDKINKFENSIEKFRLGKDDHSGIFILIGNYINNFIDNYINDLIFSSSNKAVLNQIKNLRLPKFYYSLENSLKNKNEINDIVLMKKLEGYKLNLTKIYTNLFKDISKIDKIGIITQGDLNEPLDNKYEGKVHRILNSNYSEIKSQKESCFVIDYDIIDSLSKHPNLDINIGDKNGHTPLFRAIEMKNYESVNKLINNGASIKQKDINGNNALSFALKNYRRRINKKYVNIYKICDEVAENVFEDYKNKYDNNLPKNANIIFKMALHMLNHDFLLIANSNYTGKDTENNKWNFEQFKNLKEKLENDGFLFHSALPLLDVSLSKEDFSQLNLLNLKLNQTSENINTLNKDIKNIEDILSGLRGEKKYINMKHKPLSSYDESRLFHVDSKIKEYESLLNNDNNNVKQEKITLDLVNNKSDEEFDDYKNKFVKNKRIPIFDTVVDLYDYAYIDVLNYNKRFRIKNNIYDYDTNYMSYSNIWRKYLQMIENNLDYTSFMEVLNVCQLKILNNKDKRTKENLLECKPIFKFYNEIVFPYINDYIRLPKELDSVNKPLDNIIDIIEHVVKRTLLVPFYYEVVANIQAYLEESLKMSQGNADQTIIEKFLRSITMSGIDKNSGSKLADYIFGEMPKKLIKKILDIYQSEDEYDDLDKREDINVDGIFENIVNIINITSSFRNDSPLIANLKDKTITRHKEYITIAIKTLFMLMNNYLYYLYDQCRDINIIERLPIQ